MVNALVVLAVSLVAAEILAARETRKVEKADAATKQWSFAYRWRRAIGITFAVCSAFVYYPLSGETESYRVMGFPLMVAAFDEAGRDYVAPFTVPSFIGNAVIGSFFPK